MLACGIISSSTSPHNTPIHLAKKKGSEYTVPTKRLGTPPDFQCILMALRVLNVSNSLVSVGKERTVFAIFMKAI